MYTMEIQTQNQDIILTHVPDFDLRHIFECGQAFRFDRVSEHTYFGVAYGHGLKISQYDDRVILHNTPRRDFDEIWYPFFDLGRDYGAIKRAVAKDAPMRAAVQYGFGIRILRQELWETVISFIISASNNIPRIKGIIERLCQNFGTAFVYEGKTCYAFPTAERLAALSLDELSVIRAGYRDRYILDAAKKIAGGEISLQAIQALPTPEAKAELMKISGVGNKVSDCILLFGLNRADSFPVDVWIKRIMEQYYFGREATIREISELAAKKFGAYGGFAQQYLFFHAREETKK